MAIIKPISVSQQIARNEAIIRRAQSAIKAHKAGLQNLASRYKNLGQASKAATAKTATIGKAASVGTGAGLAAVGAAGAIGAGAIAYSRYKLGKEINAQNQSGQKAYDMGIKLIKAKRAKGIKPSSRKAK
jgi:hypothetical protein